MTKNLEEHFIIGLLTNSNNNNKFLIQNHLNKCKIIKWWINKLPILMHLNIIILTTLLEIIIPINMHLIISKHQHLIYLIILGPEILIILKITPIFLILIILKSYTPPMWLKIFSKKRSVMILKKLLIS